MVYRKWLILIGGLCLLLSLGLVSAGDITQTVDQARGGITIGGGQFGDIRNVTDNSPTTTTSYAGTDYDVNRFYGNLYRSWVNFSDASRLHPGNPDNGTIGVLLNFTPGGDPATSRETVFSLRNAANTNNNLRMYRETSNGTVTCDFGPGSPTRQITSNLQIIRGVTYEIQCSWGEYTGLWMFINGTYHKHIAVNVTNMEYASGGGPGNYLGAAHVNGCCNDAFNGTVGWFFISTRTTCDQAIYVYTTSCFGNAGPFLSPSNWETYINMGYVPGQAYPVSDPVVTLLWSPGESIGGRPNLTATSEPGGINLTWTTPVGASYYKVYTRPDSVATCNTVVTAPTGWGLVINTTSNNTFHYLSLTNTTNYYCVQAFHSSGDYALSNLAYNTTLDYSSLTVQVIQCARLTTDCESNEKYGGIGSATVTMYGNQTASKTTDSNGRVVFTIATDQLFGLISLYPAKSGYQGLQHQISANNEDMSVEIYLYRSVLTIEPRDAEFVVPAPAIHFINKSSGLTFYWGIYKTSQSGQPSLLTQLYPVTLPNETTRYPLNGPTTNTPGISNHTGQYFISVTDRNGTLVDSTSFVICSTNVTCQPQGTTSPSTNLSMQTQSQVALQVTLATLEEELETSTTKSKIQATITWAYDDVFIIPNMYLLLMASIFAMGLVFWTRSKIV